MISVWPTCVSKLAWAGMTTTGLKCRHFLTPAYMGLAVLPRIASLRAKGRVSVTIGTERPCRSNQWDQCAGRLTVTWLSMRLVELARAPPAKRSAKLSSPSSLGPFADASSIASMNNFWMRGASLQAFRTPMNHEPRESNCRRDSAGAKYCFCGYSGPESRPAFC